MSHKPSFHPGDTFINSSVSRVYTEHISALLLWMTAINAGSTFESRQFLQLPVVAQAEARGALPLVLFDRRLGTWLLPLQQLGGGGDAVASLPVGVLLKREKCHHLFNNITLLHSRGHDLTVINHTVYTKYSNVCGGSHSLKHKSDFQAECHLVVGMTLSQLLLPACWASVFREHLMTQSRL